MIQRIWKQVDEVTTLPHKGIRYDEGSYISEILEDSWKSYDVIRRIQNTDGSITEILNEHDIPRLPRNAWVEEFYYAVTENGYQITGWALQVQQGPQKEQGPQKQQGQQNQQGPQKEQGPQKQQGPQKEQSQQLPKQQQEQQQQPSLLQRQQRQQKMNSQQHLQRRQQHPKQGRVDYFQEQGYMKNNFQVISSEVPSSSEIHSPPQQEDQPKQELHSLKHRSVQPPLLQRQQVIQSQSWTPLVLSIEPDSQYRRQESSYQQISGSLCYSPQQKVQRPRTSKQEHSKSFQRDNARQELVGCQILD
jgi:hypothetical protein